MNKCHFLGKLDGEPDVYTEKGVSVIRFTLEVEEYRKGRDGEKIRSNVNIIKNNFNLPVELHTSAPVCSKTRIYLEKEDIKVKSLGAK